MARKSPGAARAAAVTRLMDHEVRDIRGLSKATLLAIQRIDQTFWLDAVAGALTTYRAFLRRPGRHLLIPLVYCSCCDVVDARDTLDQAIHLLSGRARADLRRVVRKLDAEYARRTLPNPFAHNLSAWHAEPHAWWRRRITER